MSLKSIGTLQTVLKGVVSDATLTNEALVSLSGSLQGVSVENIEAMASTAGLTAAQTAAALAAKGLNAEEVAVKLTTMGYTAAEIEAALATAGFTPAAIQAALGSKTFAKAQAGATAANVGFTASIKAAAKGLWAFLTTNPVGWAIMAAGAIFAVVQVVDALTVSFDEACEAANEAQEAYEKTAGEIDELNRELETTQSRIDELESKLSLTIVEEEELEKLKQTNGYLERQLEIKEAIAGYEKREAQVKANETLTNKGFTLFNDLSGGKNDFWIWLSKMGAVMNSELFDEVDVIDYVIAQQERYNRIFKNNPDNPLLEEISKEISKYSKIIQENYDRITDSHGNAIIGFEETAQRASEALDFITDSYSKVSKKTQSLQDKIDEFLDSDKIKDQIGTVKEMARELNGITFDKIKEQFPELAQEIEDFAESSEANIDDVINSINSSLNLVKPDDVIQKFKQVYVDLYKTKHDWAINPMSPFYEQTAQDYQELVDYAETLTQDRAKIAIKLIDYVGDNIINSLGDLKTALNFIDSYESLTKLSGLISSNLINNLDDLQLAMEAVGITDIVPKAELDRVKDYYEELKIANQQLEIMGINKDQVVFGNIDLNNRGVLVWNEENLSKYQNALDSWGMTTEEMADSISTVLGSMDSIDGVEIAYSPILQTSDGPVLLNSDTVFRYFEMLAERAGEGWTDEDFLRLDAEGMEIDGQHIQGLVAAIGDEAERVSKIMHFFGKDGALALDSQEIQALADEFGVSVEALIFYYDHLETSFYQKSKNIQQFLKSAWVSEDFADAKKSILEMVQSVDGITPQKIEKLAESSAELKKVLDQDGMSAEFLAHVFELVADGKDGFELITESALQLNSALEGMVRDFDQVTEAKSRYDAAMSVPEKDEDFKSYAEAFKALNDQFVAGTTNSNAFWAAAEFLFGEDQLAAWGWSDGLNEIYNAMQRNVGIFQDADSAGAGFLDRLNEIAVNGKITADDGTVLAEIEKFSDGSYSFDIDATNIGELAGMLDITEEAALSCLKALSMWGDVNFYNVEEVLDAISEIGLSADTLDGTAINVGALTDQLISLGYTNKDIYDILQTLQGVEGITFVSTTQDIDGLTTSLTNLGLAASDGITVKVDAESFTNLMQQMSFTKEEAETMITKLGEADGITLTNAKGEVTDLQTALEYVDTLDFATVESNIDSLGSAIDEVDEKTTDNAQQSLESIGSAAETAEEKVESLQVKINNLKGNTVVIDVDVQRKSGLLGLLGFAKGTKNAPDGAALVGEDAPELIKSGDRAYLAGLNGPEVVQLDQGDTVYTGDETRRILRNRQYVHGVIPAYSGGYNGGAHGHFKTGDNQWKSVMNDATTISATVEATIDEKSLEEQLKDTLEDMQATIDDVLKNYEFDLFMAEKHNKSAEEIIAIYQSMQAYVHEQAEEFRKLGLDENSDYIQNLQKQWWEYQDEIVSTMVAAYEKIVSEQEGLIGFNEKLLSNAIQKNDYNSVVQYADEIIDSYKQMQKAIHDEADYYRSLGYSETSEEITKLKALWWEYQDEIVSTMSEAFDQLVENANNALDEVQGFYSTIKDAAQEFAESGYITVDTLQEICSYGVQYLAFLQDENGQLTLNEESIQKVIAARTEQMAVETALNYVQQLRTALENNDIATLNNLLNATDAATTSTWSLVYSQLALLNLDDEQYASALSRINALRSLTEVAITSIGKVDGSIRKTLDETKSALDDILKYVEEMIKQEVQNQIDALEKQIDDYQSIVDLQKESLELERKKEEHTKSVTKKTKELAKIQAELAILELDTSRESQAKQIKLREQMAEIQEELTDEQNDYAKDTTSDALDDMFKSYESEKNKEIEKLKDSISSEEKLYQLAIERIDKGWDSLYDDLIKWNTQYGTAINDDLTEAWNAASGAVQQYGGYLEAVLAIQNQIDRIDSGSANGFPSTNTNVGNKNTESEAKNIVKQMKENSAAWSGASAEKRQELADENEELAKEFEKLTGMKLVRGSDGVWYINKVGGSKLYEKYHSGGIVGDNGTLQQNEVFAKLEKGEIVLNRGQQQELFRRLEFEDTMFGQFGDLFGKFSGNNLPMLRSMEAASRAGMPNISNNNIVNNINFGDNIFNGLSDKEAADKHIEISRRTVNEILKYLDFRR